MDLCDDANRITYRPASISLKVVSERAEILQFRDLTYPAEPMDVPVRGKVGNALPKR